MKLLFFLLSVGSFVLDHGASVADSVEVSVMEGDSVTLNICVKKQQQEILKWYYKDTLIAKINGDISKTCTDVQCNKDNESFRDRLKLDDQTGSLTITNTTTEHTGVYELTISIDKNDSKKIFSVSVHAFSAAERDEVKKKSVKEGEHVTLDSGVIRKTNHLIKWYFNEILIAEITGDQIKIYTDDQCNGRFRDRLKLDHQTGSLNITNTRTTDSGEYKLQINNSSSDRRHRRSISSNNIDIFKVDVIADPASGVSTGVVAGIVAVLLLCVASAVGVIYRHRSSRKGIVDKKACDDKPMLDGE